MSNEHSILARRMGIARWIALIAMAAALIVAVMPRPAHAWYGWDGMDPVVQLGDHTLNVLVAFPLGNLCDVRGPIKVRVRAPEGVNTALISESTVGSGSCAVSTETRVIGDDDDGDDDGKGKHRGRQNIRVGVQVHSRVKFEVTLDVTLDTNPATNVVVVGRTNQPVRATVNWPS